jgi:predicted tellurium resistance membrane protein TerC
MSDYMTEVGGKAVAYRGRTLWWLKDDKMGKHLCKHLQHKEDLLKKAKAEIARLKSSVVVVSLDQVQAAVDKMPGACDHTEHPLMPCLDCIGKMMRNEK